MEELHYIGHYKDQYYSAAHGGSWCSEFEVPVAKAWQSRTRAAGSDLDPHAHLCFAMNTRPLLHASLPCARARFHGNIYYIMCGTCREVSGSSISDVVKIIKNRKRPMSSGFRRWATGEAGANGSEDPYKITSV